MPIFRIVAAEVVRLITVDSDPFPGLVTAPMVPLEAELTAKFLQTRRAFEEFAVPDRVGTVIGPAPYLLVQTTLDRE
jgi:hypothetical protein